LAYGFHKKTLKNIKKTKCDTCARTLNEPQRHHRMRTPKPPGSPTQSSHFPKSSTHDLGRYNKFTAWISENDALHNCKLCNLFYKGIPSNARKTNQNE
jgi:hypothetical protein